MQISRLIHPSLKYKCQLCVFFFVLGMIYFYNLFFSIDVWLMMIIDFIYSITISMLLQLLPPRVPFGDFLFCCGQGSNCVYLFVLLYHRKTPFRLLLSVTLILHIVMICPGVQKAKYGGFWCAIIFSYFLTLFVTNLITDLL